MCIRDSIDTDYIVLAGAGDDTVELPASAYDVEGSYFDGGEGTEDTLNFPDFGEQHLGFSSDTYEDAIIGTNSAVLFATGGSANIDFSDLAYFDNFENIGLYSGDDSVYFGGDPEDSISITGDEGDDTFNFDYFLTSDISIEGGDGYDTFNITTSPDSSALNLTGDSDDDSFNFSTNISSNITAIANNNSDFPDQANNENNKLVEAINIPDTNIALITPDRIANNPPINVKITVVTHPRPFE